MTSNPGDEKVVQDPMRFKEPVQSESQNVTNLSVGERERPFTDEGDFISVDVPDDFDTIQEAVYAAPYFGEQNYIINLSSGTYDEDLYIPSVLLPGGRGHNFSGTCQLQIAGDESTPSNVEVGSVRFDLSGGPSKSILRGVTLLRDSPYSSHDTAIEIGGGGEVFVRSVHFHSDVTRGVTLQKGDATVRQCNFDNLQDGVWAKRASHVDAQNNSGTASRYAYWASDGGQIVRRDDSASGGLRDAMVGTGGFVHDTDSMAYYNEALGNIGTVVNLSAEQTISTDTETTVQFSDPRFEDTNVTSNGTDSVTVNNKGRYEIGAKLSWNGTFSSGDRVVIAIKVNGVDEWVSEVPVFNFFRPTTSATTVRRLSEGDVITVSAEQESGSDAGIAPADSRSELSVLQCGSTRI